MIKKELLMKVKPKLAKPVISKDIPKNQEEEAEEEIEEDKDVDAGDEMSVTQKLLNYLKKKGVPSAV